MGEIKVMRGKVHFPGERAILPKWRLFLLLFLEGTHARLLGMGSSQVTVLKVVTAVPGLEDSLAPASPGSFVAQCVDRLLW